MLYYIKYLIMKSIVSMSYKRMPQTEVNSFASTVYQRMTDDAQFKSLKPQVDQLKVLNTAFEVALANAAFGGTDRTRAKNDCFEALLNQLDNIAVAVNTLANGHDLVAMAAGFDVRRAPKPVNELSTPSGLMVENAPRTGAIKARWSVDPAVVNYAIEHQVKGATEWKNGTYSTSREAVLSGFPSGSYVMIKICGLGRKGLKSDWTEPVGVWVI